LAKTAGKQLSKWKRRKMCLLRERERKGKESGEKTTSARNDVGEPLLNRTARELTDSPMRSMEGKKKGKKKQELPE